MAYTPHMVHMQQRPPASVIDHDDYQLEIEPSLYPNPAQPPSPPPDSASSAALMSLLQRARAQTGEQHQANTRAVAAVQAPDHHSTLLDPDAPPALTADPDADPDLDATPGADAATPTASAAASEADADAAAHTTTRGRAAGNRADAPTKRAQRADATRAKDSAKDKRRAPPALDADLSAEGFAIDEDNYELGDIDDLQGIDGAHEPDAFMEEDSGPVPTSASTRLGGARTRRSRKGDPKRVQASKAAALAARAQAAIARIPQRAQIALIAAMMLMGLAYVFFGGSDAPTEDTAAAAASQTHTHGNPNSPYAPPRADAQDRHLIPLDGDGLPSVTNNNAIYPLSALAPAASPLQHKPTKMGRVCVLRDGPASRFKALIQQTPPGAMVTILAESESGWRLVTHQGLTGWTKGACNASGCELRQGPSPAFKVILTPDESLKTTPGVTSGDRWRYVKVDDTYGWMGPACWK
jgi:hypothetical protein